MSRPDPARTGTPRRYVVLINPLGRYSLWPADLDAPVGWPAAYGPAPRAACLNFLHRAPSPGRPAAAASAA
ncbi:hypothetical protein SUDANB58_05881 (plasmid) [Streptomyces sp. enrichment culture]|uniref:MbtH family NRPS accessory protein n=1 Tax=Streptomyces sp. enrichment culture TaxID=1795815 RepID=UPI003F54A686